MIFRNYHPVESLTAPHAGIHKYLNVTALSSTLTHSTRRSCSARVALLMVMASLALVTWSRPVIAQTTAAPRPTPSSEPNIAGLSKWPVDRNNPESSIPTPEQRDTSPLEFGYFLMDVSDLAEAMLKRGRYLDAIKYFKTLAKAVPDRAVSFRKICKSYQALGEWQNALNYCGIALSRLGVLDEDFERFARIALDMKPGLTQRDGQDLDAVAQHLRTQLPQSTLADEITCETGLKLKDNRRLKDCTDRLTVSAPNDPKTFTFRWAFALQRGDAVAARHILEEAKRKAIPPKMIRNMEEATVKYASSMRWRWLSSRPVLLGAVLLILIAGVAASLVMRRRQTATTS
jgi:hypothetical protein